MNRGAYAHRILARILGRSVVRGERITIAPDRTLLSGARGPVTLLRLRERGRPAHPDRLVVAMDFNAPEVESQVPRSRVLCRELADLYGIQHLLDVNLGIGSQAAVESALVLPGQMIVGCGRCLGVTGGIGALPLRLDEETLVGALVSGSWTLEVPPVVRVEMAGRPERYVGPLDLAFAVAEALGPSLPGSLVEIHGSTRDWSVDLRMGLCGVLLEMGAVSATMAPSGPVVRFYKDRGVPVEESDAGADADAYEASVSVDLRGVGARMAKDYAGPSHSLPARDGDPIQGVFVGSCYGGRYEDLSIVAEVLKRQGRVHANVRLAVSPATLETARAALAAGFYETFLNAGAMVVVPGAGPGSAGGGAMFGEGERIVSTAEYHRLLSPGQGMPEVVLLSPAAAAVSAALGRLTDPAPFLV